MLRLAAFVFAGVMVGASGCETAGPKPDISLMSKEVAGTRLVGGIFVSGTTGVDPVSPSGQKLVSRALSTYKSRARPQADARALLTRAGAPEVTADVLAAPYQAAFIKLVEAHAKGGPKPDRLQLPVAPTTTVAAAGSLPALTPQLRSAGDDLATLAASLRRGQVDRLTNLDDESLALLGRTDSLLFDKMGVTYVLLTHVVGDETQWLGGRTIHYAAALVNARTGQMRYFATVAARKGTLPAPPFMAQLAIMAGTLFDEIAEADPLPEAPEGHDLAAQ